MLEKDRIITLADKGVAPKEVLDAAACALKQCSAEFVEGSAEWRYYAQLEKMGNSPEYAEIKEQLANETISIKYTDPMTGKEVSYEIPLFEYTSIDSIKDGIVYADGKYQLTERGLGAIQAMGGAVEIIGGAVACATPITCAAGAVVATSGFDNLLAGSNTIVTGVATKTAGAGFLEALGVPAEYSEISYAVVGLGGATTIVLKAPSGKLVQVVVSNENKVTQTAVDSVPSYKPGNSVTGNEGSSIKPNTGSTTGQYLDDFKPSSTPLELVQNQAGLGAQTASIRMDHILDGNITIGRDGIAKGSGGHYLRSDNIKVDNFTGAADANGVSTGYISVRDPNTGSWVKKTAETTIWYKKYLGRYFSKWR